MFVLHCYEGCIAENNIDHYWQHCDRTDHNAWSQAERKTYWLSSNSRISSRSSAETRISPLSGNGSCTQTRWWIYTGIVLTCTTDTTACMIEWCLLLYSTCSHVIFSSFSLYLLEQLYCAVLHLFNTSHYSISCWPRQWIGQESTAKGDAFTHYVCEAYNNVCGSISYKGLDRLIHSDVH